MTDQTIIPAKFDYAALDVADRVFIEQRTGEIKTLLRKTASNIIEVGAQLLEVKERLPYGQFGAWLEAEFHWSHSTADNYMAVAARFVTVTNLDQFAPSALYMLARPSTPEEVIEAMQAQAAAGEKVTQKGVKQAIAATRPTSPHPDRVLNAEQWILDSLLGSPTHSNLLERDAASAGYTAAEFSQALQNLTASKEITQSGRTYSLAQTRAGSDADLILTAIQAGARNYVDITHRTGINESQRIAIATNYLVGQGRIKRHKDVGFVAVESAAAAPAPVTDQPGESAQPDAESSQEDVTPSHSWRDGSASPDILEVAGLLPIRQREFLTAVALGQPVVKNAATRVALVNRKLIQSHDGQGDWWDTIQMTDRGRAVAAVLLGDSAPAEESEQPAPSAVTTPADLSPLTAAALDLLLTQGPMTIAQLRDQLAVPVGPEHNAAWSEVLNDLGRRDIAGLPTWRRRAGGSTAEYFDPSDLRTRVLETLQRRGACTLPELAAALNAGAHAIKPVLNALVAEAIVTLTHVEADSANIRPGLADGVYALAPMFKRDSPAPRSTVSRGTQTLESAGIPPKPTPLAVVIADTGKALLFYRSADAVIEHLPPLLSGLLGLLNVTSFEWADEGDRLAIQKRLDKVGELLALAALDDPTHPLLRIAAHLVVLDAQLADPPAPSA